MNQSFDSSNMEMDIDSLSEPLGFAMGGEVESMHLTPYTATNQENGDFQDAHSMPQTYAQGGEIEIGDYSVPSFRQRGMARQMLQKFADGGSVQGRPVGGMFDLGAPAEPFTSPGMTAATAPGGIGATQYNKNISDYVTANIHQNPAAITSAAQQYGVSNKDITSALGGQTLESKFRAEPAFQTTTVTNADGTTRTKDLFGPATMLTGGTGSGANWSAPIVTSRPRQLVDVQPGLSASQQHARNLVAGDQALQQSFARTGLAMDPATYYTWQRQLDSGQIKPEDLPSKFDAPAYEKRVLGAYSSIGRQGMGSDLSSFHPTSMGEMYKTYFNPNATAEDIERVNQQYSKYGTNWNAQQANKARTEVLIPSLQAQDYYARNPDVAQAFETSLQSNPNLDYAAFAKDHYNRYGKKEGRTWDTKIAVGAYEAPTAEDFAKIDPSGYNYWLNALKTGEISAADFDKLFYGGVASYQGPYADLYKGSMDKASEIINARNLAATTGATRTLPGATGYQYKDQWQVAQPVADTTAAREQLSNLYQTTLGRPADEAGLKYWMDTIGADGVLTQDEINTWNAAAEAERTGGTANTANTGEWRTTVDDWFQANPNASQQEIMAAASNVPGMTYDPQTGNVFYNGEAYASRFAKSFPDLYASGYRRGGEVSAAKMLENFAKKPNGAASSRMAAPVRMANGGPLSLGSVDPSRFSYSYDAMGNLVAKPLMPQSAVKPITLDPSFNSSDGDGTGITDQGPSIGQGVNTTAQNVALGLMGYGQLGPLAPGSMVASVVGNAIADQQIDAMANAANALSANEGMNNMGIATVSDAHGNISTVSNDATIAAADEASFGPEAVSPEAATTSDDAESDAADADAGDDGDDGDDGDGDSFAKGGEVLSFIKRASGSPEQGEVAPEPVEEEKTSSAAETMKKLGLSVARGVPQVITGAVDLAAMPFTLSGMVRPEEVVGSTEYLTKRGLLPPPQKGVLNETAELIGSAVNPAGAVKGTAAAALGAMTRGAAGRQLVLPFGEAAKAASEAPMIRAYTGHTREIVGPYDVERGARTADMGQGLYLTDNAEYASRSATKRIGKAVPESEAAPAVYPVDIAREKILMLDQQYPREVLDKLRKFSTKVENVEGPTVSGEFIYEQVRKANIPKTMLPGVFKIMGFQGAEFMPGGVSGGRSYVIYDTTNTAKGAFTGKKFKHGGEATTEFIKKSSKRR